ncbi:MAG: NADH-quinone oxidoreductase subunit J [Planctomycetia bacterium]|jgi:NADH-quinone oxidoreductase subunit J
MSETIAIIIAAAFSGTVGFFLILPAGRHEPIRRKRYLAGILLLLIALGLFGARITSLGSWLADSLFYVLAGVTLVSAAATVSMRKPVYAALWFGMTLLGTAGLFLFQGAQFLAVATIVVYAGAILVTYLFVLILAQPEGRARYDRTSTEPLLAAVVGMVLITLLTITIDGVVQHITKEAAAKKAASAERLGFKRDPELKKGILADQHVARLGTELFARHLVAVEVAGVLLFVALVGATAVSRDAFIPWKKKGTPPTTQPAGEET